MRYVWRLGLAAVAAAIAWGLYVGSQTGTPVETAAASYGPIREFVDEEGKTRLPNITLVTMPYNGRVERIDLVEGAPVTAGQAVARVVPLDLDLDVDAAQAEVDRLAAAIRENDDTSVELTGLEQSLSYVKSMDLTVAAAEKRVESGLARFELAKNTLKRLKDIRERERNERLVSEERMEQAEVAVVEGSVDYQQDVLVHRALQAVQAATALLPTAVRQYIGRKDLKRDVLEKERNQAITRLKQVQSNKARGTMTSPVDGVVLSRFERNERHLAAGTVLLEIGRLEDLEIEADVLSQDVVNLKIGDEAEIYGPAIGPAPAKGQVARIYPAGFTKVSSLGVEQQRVKVIVRLDPDELARLRGERELGANYRVNVRIFTNDQPRGLLIKRSALFRGAGGNWQVFAVRNGVAKLQEIEVGLMNDELVEVAQGLAENELVVLAPETNLVDGAAVAPIAKPSR